MGLARPTLVRQSPFRRSSASELLAPSATHLGDPWSASRPAQSDPPYTCGPGLPSLARDPSPHAPTEPNRAAERPLPAYPAATPHCEVIQVASTVALAWDADGGGGSVPSLLPSPARNGAVRLYRPAWPSAALPRRRSTLWSPVPSTVEVQTVKPGPPIRHHAHTTLFNPDPRWP